MAGLSAEDIVRLFEEDARARKRLAELLVSEPDVRLAIINAVLRDVATKQDLREMRDATRQDLKGLEERLTTRIEGVERDMNALRERLARLEGAMAQLAERIGDLNKRMDYMARVTLILTGSVIATLVATIILS
ncbi:MAG: hypothetical protein LRS43_02860 [Desulfurococcales archaeon]|nr:hypothetical protein [Desulfurococcales archaeon]